jgi:uncharacterized protein YjbI with pentapeptide repeats
MQIKNLTPFAYGHARTSRKPPRPEMTLVVRGRFQIESGGVVSIPRGIPAAVQGPLTGDVFEDDDDDRSGECLYASDLAELKLNAEVLLRGSCHAPFARPATECPVLFSVGAWSKILRVVGPRVWTEGVLGSRPTEPIPFTRMPLCYTNSFGGPGYAANPVGKGHGSLELPTIEAAGEPIRARGDRPAPAGFGPLNPAWPQRQRKMGKARSKHFGDKGSPFHGEDFDWTYFNAAPADQQLPGYLRGDEELVFQNLHPTIQVLSTRLPAIRVRAFVNDDKGSFREVRMNLDTLFADLGKDSVFLTWRGLDAVGELDLIDVKTVLFASEAMSAAPLSLEHYRAILADFERSPRRLDEVFPDQAGGETLGLATGTAPSRAPVGARVAAGPDALSTLLEEKLGPIDEATKRRLHQSLSALTTIGAQHGVDYKSQIARALDAARPAPVGPTSRPSGGGARQAMRELHTRMEALRQEATSRGRPVPARVDEYDQLLKDPRMARLGLTTGAEGASKGASSPGPGCDLSGEDLGHQDLSGRDLRGARLDGTILTRANLQNAQLAGASLRQAILDEADLTGADLTGADLSGAVLIEVRARGAIFRGARLDGTIFHEADLTFACLEEASGSATIFSRANLTEVNGRRSRFLKAIGSEAILERADFSGAELLEGVFAHTRARDLDLSGARLSKTSFLGSDLRSANLLEVSGEQTSWIEADLTAAELSYSVLPRAIFNQANAEGARFFCADLRQGKFYRTRLDRAELVRANLFEANLTMASITGARFIDANLYDAKLVMVTGTDHDFNGANLKRAVLEIKNARG